MIKLKKYFQFILTPKEKLNLLFCFGITIIIAVIEAFGIGLIPGFVILFSHTLPIPKVFHEK